MIIQSGVITHPTAVIVFCYSGDKCNLSVILLLGVALWDIVTFTVFEPEGLAMVSTSNPHFNPIKVLEPMDSAVLFDNILSVHS